MSKRKIIISVVVLSIVAVVIFAVSSNSSKSEGIAVEVEPVSSMTIIQSVNATGRIQPKTQIKISADVSAKIVALAVREGEWVEKGDFLFELDNERYYSAVESAEASVRSAEANARLASANMVKYEKDYVRTKELFDQNLESQSVLEAAYAAHEVEKSRYNASLDQVEQAKAALKQARDDLSKTRIYAPMSGTISELNKEEGEMALGSQFQEDVIMVISNLAGMEALVDVDENDVVNISIGDTATVEVDALPAAAFKGVVTEIANSAKISGQGTTDQKTEFEVKIALAAPTGVNTSTISGSNREMPTRNIYEELRPGMTASSDIVTNTHKDVLGIPIQCVAVRTIEQLSEGSKKGEEKTDDGTATSKYTPDREGFVEIVFVVNSDTVEARQVKTGIQSDTHIEILKGLSESEVIVTGNYRAISKDLQDGSRVLTEKEALAHL